MKFIYHIAGKEQNEIDSQLNNAINNKNFSRWYWAIYWADEECLKVIQDNFDSFVRLYICSKSNGKENNAIYNWAKESEPLKFSLFPVSSRFYFHPKVYLFCNDDETQWQCFISSANFTKSDMVQAAVVLTNDDDPDEKERTFYNIKKLFAVDYPNMLSLQNSHWISIPYNYKLSKFSYYSKKLFLTCLTIFHIHSDDKPLDEWRKSDLLNILFFPQWQKIIIHHKNGEKRKDLIIKGTRNAHKNRIYLEPTLLYEVLRQDDSKFWKLLSRITREGVFEKEDYIAFHTHVTETYRDIEPFNLLCQTTLILSILAPAIYPFIFSENSFLLEHLGSPSFKEEPFKTYWNNVMLPCFLIDEDIMEIDEDFKKYDEKVIQHFEGPKANYYPGPAMLQYLKCNQLDKIDFKKYIKDSFTNENRIGPSPDAIFYKETMPKIIEILDSLPGTINKRDRKFLFEYLSGKEVEVIGVEYKLTAERVRQIVARAVKKYRRKILRKDQEQTKNHFLTLLQNLESSKVCKRRLKRLKEIAGLV